MALPAPRTPRFSPTQSTHLCCVYCFYPNVSPSTLNDSFCRHTWFSLPYTCRQGIETAPRHTLLGRHPTPALFPGTSSSRTTQPSTCHLSSSTLQPCPIRAVYSSWAFGLRLRCRPPLPFPPLLCCPSPFFGGGLTNAKSTPIV